MFEEFSDMNEEDPERVKKVQLYSFFHKVISGYHAASFSIATPVCVKSPMHGRAQKFGKFSLMYYDCFNQPNGPKGKDLVRRRIEIGRDEIEKHLEIHVELIRNFSLFKVYAEQADKNELMGLAEDILSNFSSYSKILKEHHDRLGKTAFLHWPTILSGHYVQINGLDFIKESVFNPSQDREGFEKSLEDFGEVNKEFNYLEDILQPFDILDLDIDKMQEKMGIVNTLLRDVGY